MIGRALPRCMFEFTWTASPLVPGAGALAGEVLRRPVVATLRRAAE